MLKMNKKQIIELVLSFATGCVIALVVILAFLSLPNFISQAFVNVYNRYEQGQQAHIEKYNRTRNEQGMTLVEHINQEPQKPPNMKKNE